MLNTNYTWANRYRRRTQPDAQTHARTRRESTLQEQPANMAKWQRKKSIQHFKLFIKQTAAEHKKLRKKVDSLALFGLQSVPATRNAVDFTWLSLVRRKERDLAGRARIMCYGKVCFITCSGIIHFDPLRPANKLLLSNRRLMRQPGGL